MRALISTIEPVDGGVPSKLRWLLGELLVLGITPVLAWYEPWSRSPRLSVPAHALLSGRFPGSTSRLIWEQHEGHGIGCWLPELEFTHYLPGRHWRDLIRSSELHIAVTGNPLCAHRFVSADLPFLAWIGSDWQGDRQERVRRFPLPRRLLDQGINGPLLRRMERRVLQSPRARLLTISQVTAGTLERLGGRPPAGVLYRPPDACFQPEPRRTIPWRLGFSGRTSDPRKRLSLLLDVLALLLQQGHPAALELTGDPGPDRATEAAIAHRGLEHAVRFHGHLSIEDLAAVMQQWDLFVIPSSQEGLCIAGLEAMACGVPVVSTRCGGPTDYVIPDQTGTLVDADPVAMAAAIATICSHREQRARLSEGALAWIQGHAHQQESRRRLRWHLRQAFPQWLNDGI